MTDITNPSNVAFQALLHANGSQNSSSFLPSDLPYLPQLPNIAQEFLNMPANIIDALQSGDPAAIMQELGKAALFAGGIMGKG